MARLVWSKNLTRVFSAESFSLKKAGVIYAVVQKRTGGGYFAYSGSGSAITFNTHHLPAMTLHEAKDYALKAVKGAEKHEGRP
ncbi:MAG TPA: hypothetical protein DCW88_12525 [Agrobacterium sp.]|uniref:hypothetical protein n=1 Tax=Agrobacterium pusense TaxID=648995 RepID=UPI000E965149|nr:hypothetical protein [Agrobacterium sp.]